MAKVKKMHSEAAHLVEQTLLVNGGLISTARIYRSKSPYETVICLPDNDRDAVRVEVYDTMVAAAAGHLRWRESYSDGTLPDLLVHVDVAPDQASSE